jgi:autotransporter-associated beta strand protein
LVDSRFFIVGTQSNSGTGVATFTGGTAAISNGSYEIIIGDAAAATGVLNVGTEAGGNALITTGSSPLGIQVTDNLETSGSATLNLNPGTVNIQGGAITKGGAAGSTATVNLNGVTLQAGLLGFLLIDNSLNSVDVYNGGLIVDTQGNNTAITANLSATTGNGIYANNGNGALAVSTNGGILTLSGVNMYSGPTNVSGGSLVLAAAGSLPTGTNLSIAAGASVVANNLGTPIALSVGSLSVAGTLDLNNNSLVVHSSTLAAVTSLVKSGYNNGGWNGNVGIISSAAANWPQKPTAPLTGSLLTAARSCGRAAVSNCGLGTTWRSPRAKQ